MQIKKMSFSADFQTHKVRYGETPIIGAIMRRNQTQKGHSMPKTAPQEADILNQLESFANTHVFPQRESLISSRELPAPIWQAFAKSGLAGLTIPSEESGLGADYPLLSEAMYRLNRLGGVPGLTMVFSSHWLITKLHILAAAPEALQNMLLPGLNAGDATLSVAISEPGAGAHPKKLTTRAKREGDYYILNGEKAFLTNGPISDYYITLAITGEQDNHKAFSALLVPADTSGLERTIGVPLDFLHPCPHGGIKLNDCRIPVQNLIGPEGKAFEHVSLKMRAVEDAIGAGGQVGSLERLLADLTPLTKKTETRKLGALKTQILSLKIVADHLAYAAADIKNNTTSLLELHLGFRQQSEYCLKGFDALIETITGPLPPATTLLARDIAKIHAIAHSAHTSRLVKIGEDLQKTKAV